MIAEHEPEITNTNKQELIVKVFHTINVEAHFIYDISTKSFKILLSNVGSFIFSLISTSLKIDFVFVDVHRFIVFMGFIIVCCRVLNTP